MAMTRDELLGVEDREVHEIGPVPRWGKTVFVRELSVRERNASTKPLITAGVQAMKRFGKASMADLTDAERAEIDLDLDEVLASRIRRVAMSLCDKDGVLLFEDVAEGVAWCEARHPDAIDYVATEVDRINAISEEGQEEAEKNSGAPRAA